MTYYLIDSENVANGWANLVPFMDRDHHVVLYYSDVTAAIPPFILHALQERRASIEFVACNVGPNAMDFQLVTDLGYRIAKDPDSVYVIVSKDTGYDPVVHFWTDRGTQVTRKVPGRPNPMQTVPPAHQPAPEKKMEGPVYPFPAAPSPMAPNVVRRPDQDPSRRDSDRRRDAILYQHCYDHYTAVCSRFIKLSASERTQIVQALIRVAGTGQPDACFVALEKELTQKFGKSRYNAAMTKNLKSAIMEILTDGPFLPV